MAFVLVACAGNTSWANAKQATMISEETLKLRDPFKPPARHEALAAVSPLQRYPLERITLTGVLLGKGAPRAALTMPDGNTYFVTPHAKLGIRQGTVKLITRQKVVVTERIVNVLGQEELIDTEIQMAAGPSEDANAAKPVDPHRPVEAR